MKTKMMKRTLSTILASTMALSLFASMPAFADGDETTQPPQPTYLYNEDFNNCSAVNLPNLYNGKPTKKANGTAATKITDNDVEFINKSSNDDTDKYVALKSGTRTYVHFDNPFDKNSDTVVVEYDANVDSSTRDYTYFGIANAATNASWESQNVMALCYYGAWNRTGNWLSYSVYKSIKQNSGYIGTAGYTQNDGKTNTQYWGDPESTDNRQSFPLTLAGDKDKVITKTKEEWQHYKFEIEPKTGYVTVWVDGNVAEKYMNYELNNKVSLENGVFDSIGIARTSEPSLVNGRFKLDNLKVYVKDDNNSAFISENPITQDSETGVVTAKFKYAMDSTPIKLYDADGNDVTKLVTMSEDKKTATITPSISKTKGLYYVKVGNYNGQTYGPAEKEQTVQLNWEGEPRTYLYYEDFENDTVENAPNSFYDGNSNLKYSDTENRVKADKSKVAVKNDSEKGNYAEIITSSDKQAKIFLGREVSRTDGTVVLELDIKSKLNSDWHNCNKEILYQRSANNDDVVSSALWFKGSDKQNPYGFNENIYTKMSDRDEDRWNGTNESRLLKYYNGNDNKISRTEDWQHYKLELNMKTGEQQLWLDGKASEIWLDKDLYAGVAKENHKINGFVFTAKYGGDGTATNLQLDNIKVYLKDTADTSPFESVTSEKNGNVVAKFGYAIKAEDLSVYNADGKKINGTFTVAEDNKTATFVPARIEDDGLYYVQVAKLASGKVTPQTTKEFNYAPGRTKMVISDLNAVSGDVAPKFTLTHTDGEAKDVVMIVAAYKDGKMVKADVKTKPLTNEEINGVVESAPTLTLTDGEADTVKAFAWIGGTFVPIGQSAVYTTLGE